MLKVVITIVLILGIFAGIIIYNERGSDQRLNIEYPWAKQATPTHSTGSTSSPLRQGSAGQAGQATTMKQPKNIIDLKKAYSAKVSTTKGSFTIELNKGETPKTVNNFVSLATKGFYEGTIFHRVIKGFMIQGGDPTGTGTGGPGYKFEDEKFSGSYTRGTVAMANSGPNTNGSQFFVMHAEQQLPPDYIIFGHVTEGLDVIDEIADQEVKYGNSGEQSTPVDPVKILSIEISPAVKKN